MTEQTQPFTKNHKGGTLWARGQTLDGEPHGRWDWFRKTGSRLRSGTFDRGEQVGEWTTYDADGAPYKVTTMKLKKKSDAEN